MRRKKGSILYIYIYMVAFLLYLEVTFCVKESVSVDEGTRLGKERPQKTQN